MNKITNIDQIPQPTAGMIEVAVIGNEIMCGESILIRFPNGKWMVVDSCESAMYGCLPMYYLEKRGVAFTDVSYIVCTHWHRDHIKGLSKLLMTCQMATFVFAKVGGLKDFLGYIIKKCKNQVLQANKGEAEEFYQCMNILKGSKRIHQRIYAFPDRVIGNRIKDSVDIVCLSPSDIVMDHFDESVFANREVGQASQPNMLSVVLAIYTTFSSILLGGDLECNRDSVSSKEEWQNILKDCASHCAQRQSGGWCNIIEKSKMFDISKYDYIKLSHHGSITGLCPRVWSENVDETYVATLANFKTGDNLLPDEQIISNLIQLVHPLYLTNASPNKPHNESKKSPFEMMKNHVKKIKNFGDIGVIIAQKDATSDWNVFCYGEADECTIEKYIKK